MSLSRRSFVKRSSQVLATTSASVLIPGLFTHGFGAPSKYTAVTGAEHAGQLVDLARFNALVLRAVEVGKNAGALFVDARVTRSVTQGDYNSVAWTDKEWIQMGVRAFVNGAWGFASSPYCDLDEAKQLAEAAVSQAKINAEVFPRDIELGTYPAITGVWSTPIAIDPFTIPMEERSDFIKSLSGLAPRRLRGREYNISLREVECSRTEKTIATSEGALYTQTLYRTGGEFIMTLVVKGPNERKAAKVYGKGVSTAGAGWELFHEANLREQVPGLIEQVERDLLVPVEPVNVGRYDMVLSAEVAAALMNSTLARATQLDRVLGYEANATGTSYLSPDHMQYLGTPLANNRLTVTADRSMHQGLATTKWDEEGVEPDSFTLVDKGNLVDYQTNRETAGFLSEWYLSQGKSLKSHGCSYAMDATVLPLLHSPNLTMEPGEGASSMDEMISNTEHGIAFIQGGTGTDFQSRTGVGSGIMREVRNGKLGAKLYGAQLMFDSLAVWKSLVEVGNIEGMEQVPTLPSFKGQPAQSSQHSLRAVPIRLKDMAVVDGTRKS